MQAVIGTRTWYSDQLSDLTLEILRHYGENGVTYSLVGRIAVMQQALRTPRSAQQAALPQESSPETPSEGQPGDGRDGSDALPVGGGSPVLIAGKSEQFAADAGAGETVQARLDTAPATPSHHYDITADKLPQPRFLKEGDRSRTTRDSNVLSPGQVQYGGPIRKQDEPAQLDLAPAAPTQNASAAQLEAYRYSRVVDEYAKDGADTRVIAKRLGCGQNTVTDGIRRARIVNDSRVFQGDRHRIDAGRQILGFKVPYKKPRRPAEKQVEA